MEMTIYNAINDKHLETFHGFDAIPRIGDKMQLYGDLFTVICITWIPEECGVLVGVKRKSRVSKKRYDNSLSSALARLRGIAKAMGRYLPEEYIPKAKYVYPCPDSLREGESCPTCG